MKLKAHPINSYFGEMLSTDGAFLSKGQTLFELRIQPVNTSEYPEAGIPNTSDNMFAVWVYGSLWR